MGKCQRVSTNFCDVLTGVSCAFCYVYSITFLAACMVYSGRWEEQNRHVGTAMVLDPAKTAVRKEGTLFIFVQFGVTTLGTGKWRVNHI